MFLKLAFHTVGYPHATFDVFFDVSRSCSVLSSWAYLSRSCDERSWYTCRVKLGVDTLNDGMLFVESAYLSLIICQTFPFSSNQNRGFCHFDALEISSGMSIYREQSISIGRAQDLSVVLNQTPGTSPTTLEDSPCTVRTRDLIRGIVF